MKPDNEIVEIVKCLRLVGPPTEHKEHIEYFYEPVTHVQISNLVWRDLRLAEITKNKFHIDLPTKYDLLVSFISLGEGSLVKLTKIVTFTDPPGRV